jgi:chromosome partitioning protein
MTKIYAIANQKGGVGKTTSVINLSAFLASSGRRMLLVDIDPQANATSGLGYNKYQIAKSTYDILLEQADIDEVLISDEKCHIDILPAHPALSGAEVELVNVIGREYRLRQVLERLNGRYDYVLIDCPPSLSLLTINALTAAKDGIIIPVQCEYLALEGLTQLMHTIELVRKFLNPTLALRGLIMTMYDGRTNLSRQVVEEVRSYFPGKVFRTIIPRNVRLSEAPSYGQPINLYAPTSPGGIAYKVLTAELIKGDQQQEKQTNE